MPFELAIAPATFQKLMDQVLNRLKWTACLVYLDDILVFGKTFHDQFKFGFDGPGRGKLNP
jgi:hypothetical protein